MERSKISPLPEISGLSFGGKVINLNAVNENGVAANPFTTSLPSSSASDVKGVEKSYALQAGREIRVLVKPSEVDDLLAHKLARDMRIKIENTLSYPGTIKVTVIRETRVIETAK